MKIINQLAEKKPQSLTKDFVDKLGEQLSSHNEESEVVFDSLFQELKRDMDNTNEDIDILLFELKDNLVKNDAQLDEGVTFDIIISNKALPYSDRRK